MAVSPWVSVLLLLLTPLTFLGDHLSACTLDGSDPILRPAEDWAPDQLELAVPRFPVMGPGLAHDSHLAREASALSLGFLTGRRGGWRDPGENLGGRGERSGEALRQMPARTSSC